VNNFIFGMTGDLARRKILPALYALFHENMLSQFVIIGAARENKEYGDVLDDAKQFIPDIDAHRWQEFCRHCFYRAIVANDQESFKELKDFVEEKEFAFSLSGNRLLYCAVSSEFYCAITENSIETGLIKRKELHEKPWNRMAYEKPFGHDGVSSHKLYQCINKLLHDEQIYRIDHYLTHEMVSNIALVRFTNCIFEPLWNNKYVEFVHILLDESIGLEGRGASYDKMGALDDVVQNHLMELLSLAAMEEPDCLTGECVRQERAQILKHVHLVDAMLGQFDGYLEEPGVSADSTTETFASIILTIDNPRWKGVPFYLRTGKYLHKKDSSIQLNFKNVQCPLIAQGACEQNVLTIQVAPRASFSLRLNAKEPGSTLVMMPITMEYCHSCTFKEHMAESYFVLFEEIIRGIHSISVRFDEIESAWKIIDEIKKMKKEPYPYKIGSLGPKELKAFETKHGIKG